MLISTKILFKSYKHTTDNTTNKLSLHFFITNLLRRIVLHAHANGVTTMNSKHPLNKPKKIVPNLHSRWYEKDKMLLTFVGRLQKMPVALMETYCRCVIKYALELYESDDSKLYHIEAGSEKHLALLNATEKKRWCDKNPFAYRAFNALFLMDDLRRKELVTKLLESQTTLLHAYNQCCKQLQLEPKLMAFEQILSIYIKYGEQEALAELVAIQTTGNLEEYVQQP